jgi:hypothetical protein
MLWISVRVDNCLSWTSHAMQWIGGTVSRCRRFNVLQASKRATGKLRGNSSFDKFSTMFYMRLDLQYLRIAGH